MTEPRRIRVSEGRDEQARTAVLRRLDRRYEIHAIQEQLKRTTDPGEAEEHHKACVVLIKARMVEDDNPAPRPPCGCIQCAALYAAGGGA